MNIGAKIKEKREALGMSQDELAKKCGYTSRSSISKIEANANGMTQTKLALIAEALDTTPSCLMGWDDVISIEATDNSTIEMTPAEKETIELYLKLNPIAKEKIDEAVRQAIFAQVLAE